MSNPRNTIKFDRFVDKENINKDFGIAFAFLVAFLIVGLIERNWLLPDGNLGLLQHTNIWIFLFINLLLPFIIGKAVKALECNIDEITFEKLKDVFRNNASLKSITTLRYFAQVIGFCCFVGNSLQNAHIINQLPFDY